ncbi:ROK family transcriptional regulator [Rhizobium sp. BK376]|uniref:ROK family transcriptional regulator n=1 Tax=Rhizobium sp. BK376 TaxID=2512149 RepID=UPI00104E7264|nr:ROK family transcriptional regulator [Rhizobium sp. BK376]TCR71798.1 putative NBD/HSP70 family sugar kinase [Rhizobium sp. BK376]
MLFGTNLDRTQRFNRRVVLETIRLNGPLSRAEVARLTGLSAQTVTNIIDQFKPDGLLIEKARKTGGRGQPPIDLVINPSGAFSFGISFDHRRLVVVLLNLGGEVQAEIELPVTHPTPAVVLPLIEAAVNELINKAKVPRERIWGAGVVMPVLVSEGNPTVLGPSSVPDWLDFPVVENLKQRLNMPIFLDNDATAGALGELLFGAGRQFSDFFYIYLGVGLGGGIIISSHPYRGAFGMSGELGHIISVPNGRLCSCGNRGCLERYVSLSAAFADLTGEPESLKSIDLDRLYKAFEDEEPKLVAWLDEAADHLRNALVTIENLFDPQVVILGGPVPDSILDGLIARIKPSLISVSSQHNNASGRLLKSESGLDTRVLGAASLAIFDSMTPDFSVLKKERAEGG